MNKVVLFLFVLLGIQGYAQEEPEESEKGTHRISLSLSHNNVSQGAKNEDSNSKWLSLPAWSLDYDYWISDKWAIGLHTDFIVEDFFVKANLSGDDEVLERSSPVAPAAVGIYKATRHSSFLFGAGAEIAKEETLFLNRIGYEWGTEISEGWELGLTACYDFRWNAYDSYLIGIGVSRKFKCKKK
ncbi:hypothetical protein [Flavobacterium sp. AG291]|uniref:hypothetical protein n=1 Tax=Flavobacterium sp. AG291 TaxID=2184000 RepID=UPI000E0BEBE7|nr:hypothetical protein [Flavobacterium sp. AG291]RDI11905.1 hypothetical protein DEU42_10567 [Flavobacterium sp. AG291]